MVERKFKKWQLAFIVGLIFIIPIILVFQYTKSDIVIDFGSKTNGCDFTDETVCTYISDPDKVIIILSESVDKWTLTGNCITTAGEIFGKGTREFPQISFEPPSDFEECRDMISFDKDIWTRQLTFIEGLEENVFTLVSPRLLSE